jgi:hypothetical protein
MAGSHQGVARWSRAPRALVFGTNVNKVDIGWVPRGRVSKLGISKDGITVTFRVPLATGPRLQADAAAAHTTVNELCRVRALARYQDGASSMSTEVAGRAEPVIGRRELVTVRDEG